MSYREQKKLLTELKEFENKMAANDRDAFKLFLKREKDEEEFDTLSMGRLRGLHEKYYKPRPKPDISKYFKPKENKEQSE
jgi:aspartyl/asparaginyl beta-hydroxylase (cupin superfamily)